MDSIAFGRKKSQTQTTHEIRHDHQSDKRTKNTRAIVGVGGQLLSVFKSIEWVEARWWFFSDVPYPMGFYKSVGTRYKDIKFQTSIEVRIRFRTVHPRVEANTINNDCFRLCVLIFEFAAVIEIGSEANERLYRSCFPSNTTQTRRDPLGSLRKRSENAKANPAAFVDNTSTAQAMATDRNDRDFIVFLVGVPYAYAKRFKHYHGVLNSETQTGRLPSTTRLDKMMIG